MKKLILLTVTVLLMAISSVQTNAQLVPTVNSSQGQMYQDALVLAQAFLLRDTDHYRATAWSWNPNNGKYNVVMEMVMDQNLFITNMVINSTNIPLPKPLAGIPVPVDGYPNFYVEVRALDKYGNIAAEGRLQTGYLQQGDLISISMTPQFPPVAIQLEPGMDSRQIDVQIDSGFSSWGWSYDRSTGLLTIEISDPSATEINCTVRDGSGGLLFHGPLPFFQPSPGANTATNSVFNLHNDGGYVNMPLGPNGYNYANRLTFDSMTQTENGQWVPCKVIGVPDVGYRSGLNIQSYNLKEGSIEVRKWSATGKMEKVPVRVTTDPYGNISVVTTKYLDKAVIVIFPGNGVQEAYLYVGRSYGQIIEN